ncbi:GIY-YIG nuclease family protein [Salaquimonas pukyongi]|uniref:GIY-YIG nuclease family protein n=1 Tax=Salaquimonas pukyongi TaxID=2712698 RepID=UPI00096B797C|nr:GIY-YIG nuclease family protein [Salaquimonas pukyongi]
MASRQNGTLYTGVTTDLKRRAWEHRDKVLGGFTARYNCTLLVWYREYENVVDAIADEKRIKKWRRAWKIQMIEAMNPDWRDLYPNLA